ncbi:hypothetical protein [Pedobacter glucosidilyticus]|uniref:hypothetical protein n=1 Tax=Pedobacter glucosidilyticus TaxID=1122941 RepID=UPI000417C278|nr:hypothetical protein [Pedobacter glucosidilyticus]
MKEQLININLKKTFKFIFISALSIFLSSCKEEDPEFVCNGDFFLEKRVVRNTQTLYANNFPSVKKCFKILSVEKAHNNGTNIIIKIKEVGEGALGHYIEFNISPSIASSSPDVDIYQLRPQDFTLHIKQFLYNHENTGNSFNPLSTLALKSNAHDDVKAGAHNFNVLLIDEKNKTLIFNLDKIVGVSGLDSYVEYTGFKPIVISIPE